MSANGTAQVLVCSIRTGALVEVLRLLSGAGYTVREHHFGGPEPDDGGDYKLVVVEGSQCAGEALEFCRRLRARLRGRVLPILFLTDDHRPESRLASFDAGTDTYLLRPFAPAELLAQARALLRIKDTHDRLTEKTAEIHRVNKQLQQAYQQIDQELELAQRIQSSFLPQTLPQIPDCRFAVHYLLCGRVGGDFYDAFRLDENHVGFYIADAMGHGVPASLLTIFVKKGIRAKEVFGKQYRLVPPGEVLQKLNNELIEEQLSDNPFITMAYGLLNHRDATFQFARAGHPYPLYIPRDGDLEFWQQHGLLLGVADATFPVLQRQLRPGDKVLFYSDGVDNTMFEDQPTGTASLLTCAERHRRLPVDEFVNRLARDLRGGDPNPDDLTLLGLEVPA
jgi:sigma-B regulation protein RsbU (phosphoserine phosphatase)